LVTAIYWVPQPCLPLSPLLAMAAGRHDDASSDVVDQDTDFRDPDDLLEPRHGVIVGPTLGREGPQASLGSAGHPSTCVACAFYCYSLRGCAKGHGCNYCHMRHVKKIRRGRGRRRQKDQLDQDDDEEEGEDQDVQQQGSGTCSNAGSTGSGGSTVGNGSGTSCSSGSGASAVTSTRGTDLWQRAVSERDSSGSDCSSSPDLNTAATIDACLSLVQKFSSLSGMKVGGLDADLVQLLRTIKQELNVGRSGQPYMQILVAGWGPIHELEVMI